MVTKKQLKMAKKPLDGDNCTVCGRCFGFGNITMIGTRNGDDKMELACEKCAIKNNLVAISGGVYLSGEVWKRDDQQWFERNKDRTCRARPPFPGEYFGDKPVPPGRDGMSPVMLIERMQPVSVLQMESTSPGRRRHVVYFATKALPLPDDELLFRSLIDLLRRGETFNGHDIMAMYKFHTAQREGAAH